MVHFLVFDWSCAEFSIFYLMFGQCLWMLLPLSFMMLLSCWVWGRVKWCNVKYSNSYFVATLPTSFILVFSRHKRLEQKQWSHQINTGKGIRNFKFINNLFNDLHFCHCTWPLAQIVHLNWIALYREVKAALSCYSWKLME